MKRFLRPYMVTSPRAKTYHGNFLAKAVYLSIHCVYGVVTMSIIAVSADSVLLVAAVVAVT